MSYIYEKYLDLKKENKDCYYLFECGAFYLFLDEDSHIMSSILSLKELSFTKDIMKCGFPKNALSKYQEILNNKKINYKIINQEHHLKSTNCDSSDDVQKYLSQLDIYKISPMDAFQILVELKERCNHE